MADEQANGSSLLRGRNGNAFGTGAGRQGVIQWKQGKKITGTLQDAGRGHSGVSEHQCGAQAFTLTNYHRQLKNQVRECIPGSITLRKLEWDNVGREKVVALREYIEDRGSYDQAFRVQKLLAQALDHAILKGWMRRNQNPATKQKGKESKYALQTTPAYPLQVPELLESINMIRCPGHAQSVIRCEFY